MEKTTITINGEECVILPAPKGAFLKIDGVIYPDFVPFVAVNPIIKKDGEFKQTTNNFKKIEDIK